MENLLVNIRLKALEVLKGGDLTKEQEDLMFEIDDYAQAAVQELEEKYMKVSKEGK